MAIMTYLLNVFISNLVKSLDRFQPCDPEQTLTKYPKYSGITDPGIRLNHSQNSFPEIGCTCKHWDIIGNISRSIKCSYSFEGSASGIDEELIRTRCQ